MTYENLFLRALSCTIIIEVPVVILFIKYFYHHTDIKLPKIIFVSVIASALTLPYLWFVLPGFVTSRSLFIVVGESVVVLVETIVYQHMLELKFSKALVLSLVANGASVIFGLLFL